MFVFRSELGLEFFFKLNLCLPILIFFSFQPKIEERLKTRRKEKLDLIATLNECRCEAYPLYGSDLIESVRIVDHVDALTDNWLCSGLIHCQNVHRDRLYWSQTHYLNSAVKKPHNIIEELQDVLKR